MKLMPPGFNHDNIANYINYIMNMYVYDNFCTLILLNTLHE